MATASTTDLSRFLHPAEVIGMPWPCFGRADESETDEEEEGSPEGDEDAGDGDEDEDSAVLRQKLKRANAEAKKHRLNLKEAKRRLRERESGTDTTKSERDHAVSERNSLRVDNAILRVALDHGGDPEELEFRLMKRGLLELDEDGDLPEDFHDVAAAIAKEIGSGGAKPPKSPKLSKNKGGDNAADLAVLAKRYPALIRRG